MKQFLIIPLGGLGKRFSKAGYKTYKPFLKTSNKSRIIDNIANNFPKNNTHIIILGNYKKFEKITSSFKRKNTSFIKIKSHKSGPIYSIFLAKEKLKKIIKNNNFFISYSDINWNWDFRTVKNKIKKKNIVIFSHQGFHPHLETDEKSDFFLCNKKNEVTEVSEKKTINNDYRKNFLATGCYYFSNFKYFDAFFETNIFKKSSAKKELYLINLINFCLKKGLKVNHFLINEFVHLGVPSQFENYIVWRKILKDDFKKSINTNFHSVMLMAGKGQRVKNLTTKKPFLNINNEKIFKYIFDKFGSNKRYIITNNNYSSLLNKKIPIWKVKKTNSMIETVEKSLNFLRNKKNYFLLSCDCYGTFNNSTLKKFIKYNNPDVILFAFKISDLHKKLGNFHTSIILNRNKNIKAINVKKFTSSEGELGHAGFFWIRNNNVFDNLELFKKLNKSKRELILDDYFKFLFEKKLNKISCFKLNEYIHIGSVKEYYELKYWVNFFKNEDK